MKTVGDLRKALEGVDDSLPVIMPSDEEGNDLHEWNGHGTDRMMIDGVATEIFYLWAGASVEIDDDDEGLGEEPDNPDAPLPPLAEWLGSPLPVTDTGKLEQAVVSLFGQEADQGG